ncbi:zinc ABC transporter permease subunit ZnuB [Buchnera aphidicola (Muscaphis stroyani)]|uniref:High-affinity zinc uptake system membrane protein ZnuB n=1 Tax=Buchnera aphidicola (Muscaphis stroyani) TaxID=1241869 RepID=A0A4D6Y4V2_9GAMM|nr:zinc ABC transporter permease subunit ZnuB [Buchnera aphidicola]QCI24387.1 zinc ABC transporter permease subunit ZnuB [Buchnera aphidicola (Muscaphis stroyani)]
MCEMIFIAWVAGILLAVATGILGSFIVWRRMSSFGDALSHSSLLGFSISIVFDINSFFMVFTVVSLLAIVLSFLEKILPLSLDTILGIMSHSSLSLGIVFMSLISKDKQKDINSYLFGDLLSVTYSDLIYIAFGSLLILSILIIKWKSILSATINEELAQINGVNVFYARLTVMLTTALAISIAIKFVGALLVTSLLIIPPSTAQNFSGSPEKMAIVSVILSIFSVTGGIVLSVFYHTPVSSSIVLFSFLLYLLSNIKSVFFK